MRAEDERYIAIIDRFRGLLSSDEAMGQAEVLLDALDVFNEREKRYGSLWRTAGWRGVLIDLKKKTERTWREYWLGSAPADVDSPLDLINYAAFFIRSVREGNEQGSWSWREEDDEEGRNADG